MRNLKKTLILFGIILFSGAGFSQISDFDQLEPMSGNAVLSSAYCLTLDDSQPLSEFYMADISHLGFNDEKEAQKVFGMKSNNLVSYIVDFDDNRVFVKIHNDRIPQGEVGTVQWWNDYLAQMCSKYQ